MAKAKSSTATVDIETRYASMFEEADELLRVIVSEGRAPSPAELAHFQHMVSWDARKVEFHLKRVKAAVLYEAIAGDPTVRAAASQEAAAAVSLLATERPKIEAEIKALQVRQQRLENDVKQARNRVEQQNQAVMKLRELSPQHVQERADRMVADANELRIKWLELRDRHEHVVSLLRPVDRTGQVQFAKTILELFPESGAARKTAIYGMGRTGRTIGYELTDSWDNLKAKLKREAEIELPPQIEAAKAAFDAAMEEAERARDFYAMAE